MADFLAKELSLDAKEVYKDLTTRTITTRGKDGNLKTIPKRYAVIKSVIDFDEFERLKLKISKSGFKGIYFRQLLQAQLSEKRASCKYPRIHESRPRQSRCRDRT